MRNIRPQLFLLFFTASFFVVIFSSCLTSAKMDRYVSSQYNDQLPKRDKKMKADIVVNSTLHSDPDIISMTKQKTSKVVPLIVYWSMDWRHTCTLNPAIPVTAFANTINGLATKGLAQKLNGQRLELTVEQVPNAFAIVDKSHMIWLIYAISWDKIYVEPDFKDLVVSYKLTGADSVAKSGRITVKSNAENKGIRFFQSWKSATSEHLTDYNSNLTLMTRSFVNKLMEELQSSAPVTSSN